MKIIKIIITVFILTAYYLLLNTSVMAQQVSLSLSPPLLEAIIKPGKSIMIAYTVKNYGDPVTLSAKVVTFEPKDNYGNIRLKDSLEGPVRFSLDNADLALNQPFFLKTNQSQQLLLKIRVPEGATSQDYYYTLLVESEPQAGKEGVGVARAKATIGSNILLTASETEIIEVNPKIVLFDLLSKMTINVFGRKIKLFDSTDKIPVILIVENKGKNLIKPQGVINLRGAFGTSADYEIVSKNILGQSQRLIEATPSSMLLNNTSVVLPSKLFGHYNIGTSISFGENAPTLFSSSSFFVFPFKITFIILISIIIYMYIKKKKHQPNKP